MFSDMKGFHKRKVKVEFNKEIVEYYGFIKYPGNKIYVSIHGTEKSYSLKKLILISGPILREQERSSMFISKLSRSLASLDYLILKFDYFGTGNSSGDYSKVLFETFSNDFKNIINWISVNIEGVIFYAFVGIRFGFNLNYSFQCKLQVFIKNIFIHPIIDIKKHFQRCIIINHIYSQNLVPGKKQLMSDFINAIDRPNSIIDVNGFPLSGKFIKELLSFHNIDIQKAYTKSSMFILDDDGSMVKSVLKENNIKSYIIKLSPFINWEHENFNLEIDFFRSVLVKCKIFLSN